MVYSRLARRLRATGATSFARYLEALERDARSSEWEGFVNALTTNLTSFYREAHHFPLLAEHAKGRERLSVWCAASSTGEEPWSIAMTLCEAYGTLAPPVQVAATDIDTDVLATAVEGVYPAERLQGMDAALVRRYFMKGRGARAGQVRVRPELRALLAFRQLNLLGGDWPVSGPFDAIFCRNVMIYFDKPTQARILARMVRLMKPDGLLFAGHSENFSYACDELQSRGKTVYALRGGGRP